MLQILGLIYLVIWYLVVTIIVFTIALMLARYLIVKADVNPFTRTAINIRSWSDALVFPVRRSMAALGGIDHRFAPLIAVLIVILLGWFVTQLSQNILSTIAGVTLGVQTGRPILILGHILYGGLAIYSLFIFIRIVFSWGMVSHANPIMRFLVRVTDPLLVPLRRVIPPLGMLDISPIVAFILIWLFQSAIAGTLLAG